LLEAGAAREDVAVAPQLGGDEDALLVLERRDAPLGLAAAINIGRVPEIDVERARRAQDFSRRLVAHRPEALAQLPGAEPDLGDFVARLAQFARVHAATPLLCGELDSGWGAPAKVRLPLVPFLGGVEHDLGVIALGAAEPPLRLGEVDGIAVLVL